MAVESHEYDARTTAGYKDFFTADYASGQIDKVIDKDLIWRAMLTVFEGSPSRSIVGPIYRADSSGDKTSPGRSEWKRKLSKHTPGALYPKIRGQDYKYDTYSMTPHGYSIEFEEDIISSSSPMNLRKIRDLYDNVARFTAEFINWEIMEAAFNSFSYTSGGELDGYVDNDDATGMGYESTYGFICGKLVAGTYWNTDAANYLKDITQLGTMFGKQDGISASLKLIVMDSTLFEKIMLWGQTNGFSWEVTPLDGGRKITNINGIQIMSITNTDGMSGHEDKVLLFDTRVTPCVTYYYTQTHENFTRWSQDSVIEVATKENKITPNNIEVFYRTEFRTTIMYPKYYGFIEVY